MTDETSEFTPVGPDGKPWERQPPWRRDFPIDWPEDHYVARRDFTKFLVLTSLAFVVGHVWIVVQNWWRARRGQPHRVAIARLDDLPVGAARVFHYPDESEPCLLIRADEKTVLAYDQKCTHLSCAVTPELHKGQLRCPCHHGYFDVATGRPLAGPPRRPLPRIQLETRDGIVYATGIERSTV